MFVKMKKMHPDAVLPARSTELAGGWDVVATEVIKKADNLIVCKIGWSIQPPENFKITLVPRSSLTNTNWFMQNSPGLGDADYLGEYQYRFRTVPTGIEYDAKTNTHKFTYDPPPFSPGDRIGQLYLENVIPIVFHEVEELVNTERGTGGFGSTGK